MRILILHNTYRLKGGEDTVVAAETQLLRDHGHHVEQLIFDNADVKSGIGQLWSAMTSVYNRASYQRTREVISEFQPDVVHVHNTFYVASPSIYQAAKDSGVPVVQTLHNYRLICPSVYLFHDGDVYEDNIRKLFPIRAILKRVSQGSLVQTLIIATTTAIHKLRRTYQDKVNKYIVFTEFAKAIFQRSSLGLRDDQFSIKPNFIPDPGCDVSTDTLAKRGDYYLFIGRLSPEKGISVLLRAAEELDCQIKILGDGPLKNDVVEASERLENVEYLGLRDRSEVMGYLRECRALVFPSLWYEGMPMVIIEALASGTPVIVSALGNPMHMIQHENNGLHFEPGNANELALQVRQLEENEDLRTALHRGARQAYDENYSPEANYELLVSLYEEVSGKQRHIQENAGVS